MQLDSKTKVILLNPEKRWAWIKYQLNLKGISIRKIAGNLGVRPQTVGKVSYCPYPKMEKAIADTLDLTPQELFPDRYDEDGLPARSYSSRSVYCQASKDTHLEQPCKVAAAQ
jgi:Ner family transcriptional regulator